MDSSWSGQIGFYEFAQCLSDPEDRSVIAATWVSALHTGESILDQTFDPYSVEVMFCFSATHIATYDPRAFKASEHVL